MQLAHNSGISRQAVVQTTASTAVIHGINFVDTAEAHIMLFGALKDFLSGGEHESVVVDILSQMESCDLGIWLGGEGRSRFGYLAAFDRLAQTHDEFHDCAQAVMKEMQSGSWVQAEQLLKNELARLLRRILITITELNEIALGDLNDTLQKKGAVVS